MWDNPRAMNAIALILLLAAIAAGLFALALTAARHAAFTIREVRVVGALTHVDPSYLERIIRTEFKGTFFTLSLERTRAALQRAPWVKDVAVRRVWPRQIEVRLTEHIALARWNTDALVDKDGVPFVAPSQEVLPQLSGPQGTERELTLHYLNATQALTPFNLSVKTMSISPARSISAVLSNGLKLQFGRDAFDVRLARLVNYYEEVKDRMVVPITAIDLRYGRGLSVAYAANQAASSSSESKRKP
jgi:cell division protein FtsQ